MSSHLAVFARGGSLKFKAALDGRMPLSSAKLQITQYVMKHVTARKGAAESTLKPCRLHTPRAFPTRSLRVRSPVPCARLISGGSWLKKLPLTKKNIMI